MDGDGIDGPDAATAGGLEETRAALDRTERTLADVSAAMSRLDDGTYLNCEACGAPIGDDRLAADPLTRRCADCAEAGTAEEARAGARAEARAELRAEPEDG